MRSIFRRMGAEIRRIQPPGSPHRLIGDVGTFLEDVRARGLKPRGLVDVGANIGGWTRLGLRIFPGTPVLLIEPQNEMEPALRQLCVEFPQCRYIKAGAARNTGKLVQIIASDLAASSFLPPRDADKLNRSERRETTVVAIDDLLSSEFAWFKPDVVKLDIQGFELEALHGAQRLFGQTELFIIETSLFQFQDNTPLAREIIMFMAEKGYEIYDITEFLRRPSDGAVGQIDFAFAKRNGILRSHLRW